jgi:hypothetical protein
MSVLTFVRTAVGQQFDLDGAYGPQCMDLVNAYRRDVWHLGRAPGNAVDLIRADLAPWSWVPNGPTNYPLVGAVIIWRANVPARGVGPYGHAAIVLAADPTVLLTLDQNWDGHKEARLTIHDYVGVAGWHVPR